MTENNVMEFCQWLMNEKGVEAGNLSDYINNNEEEVLKLAEEFKKPKFKIGGKVEAAAEMFKCGGKTKKKNVKKAQGGMKTNPKKDQYRTAVDPEGREVSLHVYPSFSNHSKVDSMITVPAPQGGMYTLFSRYNEPKSGNRQDEMGSFDKLDPETAARLFRKNANLFNSTKKFDDGGPIGEDGIYREYIKFGPEYGRFEDNTGRYERVITPKQDTVWRFNDYGSERSVYTTPNGLEGVITTIYGDVNRMSPEEISVARKAVESRMKNMPYKKYLREKYGDEMLMPENKEKKQDGGELLSRRDLKKEAKENYGFNNKQFRDAYRNSIAAYQNKGYKRYKAKEFAQDILTRGKQEFVPTENFDPINPKHDITVSFNHKPLISPINLPESKMMIPSFDNMDGFEPMVRYAMGNSSNANKKSVDTDVKKVNIPIMPFDNKVIDSNIVMPIPSFDDYGAEIEEVIVTPSNRTNFDNIKDFFRSIRFAKPNLRWHQNGGVIKNDELKKKAFFNGVKRTAHNSEDGLIIKDGFDKDHYLYGSERIISGDLKDTTYNHGYYGFKDFDKNMKELHGTIRSDDRGPVKRFFDKIKTNYRTSDFANSPLMEVMQYHPIGVLHIGDKDNYEPLPDRTLKLIPYIGARKMQFAKQMLK